MMHFSIRTGLDSVGVAGLELEPPLGLFAGSGCYIPCKNKKQRGIGGGSPVATPMPKLVLSCGEKRSTV